MKRRSLVIFSCLLLGGALPLFSQNQKIGYIDSELIMDQIPEYSGVEQTLDLLSESWREEIREMDSEIERLQEEYATREVLYTETMRQEHMAEIDSMREARDRFANEIFGPEGDYFLRQRELLEPIQQQIYEAVSRVADREDFDFILDRAGDVKLIFARPEWNLNQQVLVELGIQVDGLGN
ncbi:MAG: OmpH family outer membrane protein [Balneolaceae bacterium]